MHEFLIKEGRTFVRAVEAQIPIDAVRLVHPVRDANTGVTRDVIIRELRPVDIFHDRPTRRTEFSRVVPGLNLEIPWPREADPAYADQPVDTLRIDVEERTFVPTLLRPPLPDRAIDELRNRFSRFRTRHEPEYVAKKEAEAADKARRGKLLQAAMRTPLQEFHIQQKALRRARGQPSSPTTCSRRSARSSPGTRGPPWLPWEPRRWWTPQPLPVYHWKRRYRHRPLHRRRVAVMPQRPGPRHHHKTCRTPVEIESLVHGHARRPSS